MECAPATASPSGSPRQAQGHSPRLRIPRSPRSPATRPVLERQVSFRASTPPVISDAAITSIAGARELLTEYPDRALAIFDKHKRDLAEVWKANLPLASPGNKYMLVLQFSSPESLYSSIMKKTTDRGLVVRGVPLSQAMQTYRCFFPRETESAQVLQGVFCFAITVLASGIEYGIYCNALGNEELFGG